jgi:hypothetical protein
MAVTLLFMHLNITFSNQRFSSCNPTVDIGFVKLTSDSFCGSGVFKMSIQFCCPVTCAAAVVIFFKQFLVYDVFVIVDFRPLFFADVVLYANISLETVALDTPNNVAVFVTCSS